MRNVEEDAGFYSYHAYWTQDFFRPNPHFGDLYKLRELVDAAHERNILVILDVVTNHVGQLFYYDINGNGQHDEWLSGGGTTHTCVQICQGDRHNPACRDTSLTFSQTQSYGCRCSPDENLYCALGMTYFERILEADPEYDPRGIQGWTSLGFSGPAEVRFPHLPQINRTAPARPPAIVGWPEDRSWFDDPSWYNRRGRVYLWWHEGDGYTQEFIREQETLGDFPGGLKDINTDHPDAKEALIRAFEFWISMADFDGFRIDTLKHIDRPEIDVNDRGFWGEFTGRIREHAASLGKQNFFMFGEAFDGNDELIGKYTFGGQDERGSFGRVDSVFYFSQKYRVVDSVFKSGAPTKNFECLYNSRFGINPDDQWCRNNGYPVGPTYWDQPHASKEQGGVGVAPNQLLVSFLDNHDLPRFLYESTPDVVHAGLFFLLTWDGIPCIYYGTEQRFNGGNDPRNREDMGAGSLDWGYPAFDTTNPTFEYMQTLIALRKEHAALRQGEVTVRWATETPAGERDHGIFAFERAHPSETLLVVLNAADQQSSTCAPESKGGACMQTSFPAGTLLGDIGPKGDNVAFEVRADGTIEVVVPPRSGRILAPVR